jgi:hypothetical protein
MNRAGGNPAADRRQAGQSPDYRAVRFLTGDVGLRQFLDIGAGLPTTSNVHEVAQAVEPSSRIVYVDNDRCKSGCAHTGRPKTPQGGP